MGSLDIEDQTVIDIVIGSIELVCCAALVHHSYIEGTVDVKECSVVEEHTPKEVILVNEIAPCLRYEVLSGNRIHTE